MKLIRTITHYAQTIALNFVACCCIIGILLFLIIEILKSDD